MTNSIRNSFILLAMGGLASIGNAQWVGSSIHPAGYTASYTTGAAPGIAVGGAGNPSSEAGYWSNSGASYTSLADPSWQLSAAFAGDVNMQVGEYENGFVHASRWFGSLATFEDLNPARCSGSQALAMNGSKAGGYGRFGSIGHALIWNGGGADDFTDLHSDTLSESAIWGMSSTQQVGQAILTPGGDYQAALWSGTADSYVNLAPIGSEMSIATATTGSLQGGWSKNVGESNHAYLWSGTAASGIDLNPMGELTSQVAGMSGLFQVGYSYNEATQHYYARLWSGSAASAVNLGDFLPTDFVSSQATGIAEYADRIEIYGFAYRRGSNTSEAVMWTQPVPEPASIAVLGLGALGLLRRRRR